VIELSELVCLWYLELGSWPSCFSSVIKDSHRIWSGYVDDFGEKSFRSRHFMKIIMCLCLVICGSIHGQTRRRAGRQGGAEPRRSLCCQWDVQLVLRMTITHHTSLDRRDYQLRDEIDRLSAHTPTELVTPARIRSLCNRYRAFHLFLKIVDTTGFFSLDLSLSCYASYTNVTNLRKT